MSRFFQGFGHYSGTPNGCVLTLGNFDGVHLGHREILKLALGKSRALGLPSVAYTFRPHPRVVLQPGTAVEFITTYDEKAALLAELGFDAVIEEPFTREFAAQSAAEFFNRVVLGALRARAVVVGYDFGFGRSREGHLEELKQLCEKTGVELSIVPALRDREGGVISSSRIRAQLRAGEVDSAASLLGHPFAYRGEVLHGDARGRTIGFPTANILVGEGKLQLPFGVYATRTRIGDVTHESVTNLGVRPTFRTSAPGPVVETHVLDFSGDLYGKIIDVLFVRRLREERRFAGIDELKRQIAMDVAAAREALKI